MAKRRSRGDQETAGRLSRSESVNTATAENIPNLRPNSRLNSTKDSRISLCEYSRNLPEE